MMLNVIYFTICHDSIIYLPLFYVQLWQEQSIKWVKLPASAENLACFFLFLSVTDFLSRHIFPQVPLRLFYDLLKFLFFFFFLFFPWAFNCSDNLWTDSCTDEGFIMFSEAALVDFTRGSKILPVVIHFSLHLFSISFYWLEIWFNFFSLDSLLSFLQFFFAAFILCCFSVSLLSYWQSKRRVVN